MRNLFGARGGEARATTRVTPTRPAENLHGRMAVVLAILILATVFVASGSRTAIAQTGGGYDLTWNSIDGGGITFSAGGS